MIEAVKIWNEPNNKSHWDPLLDPLQGGNPPPLHALFPFF